MGSNSQAAAASECSGKYFPVTSTWFRRMLICLLDAFRFWIKDVMKVYIFIISNLENSFAII